MALKTAVEECFEQDPTTTTEIQNPTTYRQAPCPEASMAVRY